ncbi:MAG: hypothetical protein ACREL1_05635 [bacterium]
MATDTPTIPPRRKNLDVECLRCGAYNLAENKICGQCGANLPLVYDEDGNVARLSVGLIPASRGRASTPYRISPWKTAWLLRAGVLLFALAVAGFIIFQEQQP